MNIKKLIILFSSLLCILPFTADAFQTVPLLKDEGFPWVKLQKHYTVKTLFMEGGSLVSLQLAIEAWNVAAQNQDFITPSAGETTAPIIYVTNTQLKGFIGLALPFQSKTCVIQVDPGYEFSTEIYIHEIGHCLGFAHNTEYKKSIMQPSGIKPTLKVDKLTTLSLQYLLKLLP